MSNQKRYGMKTAQELRDLIRSRYFSMNDPRASLSDLLDTIDELAATLTEALVVIGHRRGSRVDKIRVRARKLLDEVTQ